MSLIELQSWILQYEVADSLLLLIGIVVGAWLCRKARWPGLLLAIACFTILLAVVSMVSVVQYTFKVGRVNPILAKIVGYSSGHLHGIGLFIFFLAIFWGRLSRSETPTLKVDHD